MDFRPLSFKATVKVTNITSVKRRNIIIRTAVRKLQYVIICFIKSLTFVGYNYIFLDPLTTNMRNQTSQYALVHHASIKPKIKYEYFKEMRTAILF